MHPFVCERVGAPSAPTGVLSEPSPGRRAGGPGAGRWARREAPRCTSRSVLSSTNGRRPGASCAVARRGAGRGIGGSAASDWQLAPHLPASRREAGRLVAAMEVRAGVLAPAPPGSPTVLRDRCPQAARSLGAGLRRIARLRAPAHSPAGPRRLRPPEAAARVATPSALGSRWCCRRHCVACAAGALSGSGARRDHAVRRGPPGQPQDFSMVAATRRNSSPALATARPGLGWSVSAVRRTRRRIQRCSDTGVPTGVSPARAARRST